MTPIRSLALLLVLLSLPACEQPASPPAPKASSAQAQPDPVSAPAPAASKAVTKVAPVVEKPAEPVKPAVEPAAKPVTPVKSKPAVVARKPKLEEPKKPLDLSLDSDVFDALLPLESPGDLSPALLPPMFGEKPEKQSPFELHGRLITNDSADSYLDSVEGAQLQFEFKR